MREMRDKIVFFTEAMDVIGGMERVVSFLSSEMALSHDVVLLMMNGDVRGDIFNMPGVSIESLHINIEPNTPFKKALRYIKTISKLNCFLSKSNNIKFFVANSPALCCCSIITSFFSNRKIKYIAFEHNKFDFPSLYWKFVRYFLYKYFYRVIALTRDAHEDYLSIGCASVHIPNAMILTVKNTSEIKNKKLIAVGRLVYQKGFDLLLSAWKIVHDSCPDWTLEIVGSGPDEAKLKELAYNLNISHTINFFGETSYIQDRYLQSSGFILSSRYEGFGLVLIEAMAHGLPCISFDCESGPSEIIINDKNGFLVKNGDYEALSQSIINYIRLGDDSKKLMSTCAVESSFLYNPSQIIKRWKNEVFND